MLPLLAAAILCSSCTKTADGTVRLEQPDETAFTVEFEAWSAENACELSLMQQDTLQIEVSRDDGKIGLTIRGKNGSEPYTGNDLCPGLFTVTVSETDDYVFTLTGDRATGRVAVRNLGITPS
ncbi:MAG: hypothetical protein GXX99_03060 [Clostridiales bacterium]|nr:hypothetical protein [Clostridiales bacterium]